MDISKEFYTLCPKCGEKICTGSKFCPFCATRLIADVPQEMVCPICGRRAQEREKFCSECGVAYQSKAAEISMPVAQTVPGTDEGIPVTVKCQNRLNFFETYTSKATQNWLKVMPVLCIIACVFCVILAMYGFAIGSLYYTYILTSLFFLVCAAVMGIIVYFMIKKKSFAVYVLETVVVSVNMLMTIFSSRGATMAIMTIFALAIIGTGIYSSYKLSRVDRAWEEYLRIGKEPKQRI